MVGFARSLAAATDQYAADICVSAMCPGFADTNIIGDEARTMIAELGLDIMPPERIADTVTRSLAERVQGAQWVVWPGVESFVYEWNPPVELPDVAT